MTKPSLETVMHGSFVDIADPKSDKPLQEFNEAIDRLAENNALGIKDVQALVDPKYDHSDTIAQTAKICLAERDMYRDSYFLPGYTAVVACDSGDILGAQDKPNDIPQLQAYGPSLLWAFKKLGHERYAATRARESASLATGYQLVHNALQPTTDLSDTPYGQRHHIGGSTIMEYRGQDAPLHLYAGVSGVVATPAFLGEVRYRHPQSGVRIIREALANFDGYLDGFEGNMFAGSLDSTLGEVILRDITTRYIDDSFDLHAIHQIIARHKDGINVH